MDPTAMALGLIEVKTREMDEHNIDADVFDRLDMLVDEAARAVRRVVANIKVLNSLAGVSDDDEPVRS